MGLFDLFRGKRKNDVEESIDYVDTIQADFGDSNFVFKVDDVFSISGRGTVVTGRVLKGSVIVGDEVNISDIGKKTYVNGIEMFRKSLNEANEGDIAGLLLSDVSRNEVKRGFTLIK